MGGLEDYYFVVFSLLLLLLLLLIAGKVFRKDIIGGHVQELGEPLKCEGVDKVCTKSIQSAISVSLLKLARNEIMNKRKT